MIHKLYAKLYTRTDTIAIINSKKRQTNINRLSYRSRIQYGRDMMNIRFSSFIS